MRRWLLLLLAAALLSACTAPTVRESAAVQRPLLPTPPPCTEPAMLVRDLTVPWEERIYVIGPCPTPAAQAARATATPVAPPDLGPSTDLELTSSGRAAP